MNLNFRSSHEYSGAFNVALVACGLVAVIVGWFAFKTGGMWDVVGFLSIAALCFLVYGIWIEPQHLRVARYREALVSEPRVWLRIVFLSDFHAGSFRTKEWYERIAREVQALQPDVIFGGGDFVVDRAEPMVDLAALGALRAPLGKFFVLGNHDYMDRPQDVRAAMVSFGFTDLTNKTIQLERDGASFEVRGIDDHWRGNPQSFARLSKTVPHLLLAHEPDVMLDLQEGDTDLVLSGHTHGGQVRLPIIGPLCPIPAQLGRVVDHGKKILRGIRVIISSGLGEQDVRARLFCPAEIVLVEVGI